MSIYHLRDTHILALPCRLTGDPFPGGVSDQPELEPVWQAFRQIVTTNEWRLAPRLPMYANESGLQAVFFPVAVNEYETPTPDACTVERSCQRLLGTIRQEPYISDWLRIGRRWAIPAAEIGHLEILSFYLAGRELVDLVSDTEPRRRYFAYVDVETTGLYPEQSDEMIEIAVVCVEITGDGIGEIIDEYSGFREPVKRPDPEATAVNGITWDMIEGTKFDDGRVRDMIRGAEFLAAHNYKFDRGFLAQRYPEVLYKPWRCTKDGIDWRKRGFQSSKLQDLLAGHGISPGQAHRAMDDVQAAVTLLRQPGIFEEWMGL